MESKGLVRRARTEQSDRVVFAMLTDEGQAFFEEHFLNVIGKIAQSVNARLSAEEQLQLTTLLGKFTDG